jgi:hypothetical protein
MMKCSQGANTLARSTVVKFSTHKSKIEVQSLVVAPREIKWQKSWYCVGCAQVAQW